MDAWSAARYHPLLMNKTLRYLACLGLAIALIVVLLIVGPNLQHIELAPATPSSLPLPAPVPTTGGWVAPIGSDATPLFVWLLMATAIGSLVFLVISAIFHKEPRRYLLGLAILCMLLVGGMYALKYFRQQAGVAPQAMEEEPVMWGEGQPAVIEDIPTEPPAWLFPAVAVVISFAVAVLLLLAWRRFAPHWKRSGVDDDKTDLDHIVESVSSAADEISLGGDVRAAVLRCYREMIRILCKGRNVSHATLTARELATALHRVGFTATHVDQLTTIFELVRYGNRSGSSLAEQAINCLEAIRGAYAS